MTSYQPVSSFGDSLEPQRTTNLSRTQTALLDRDGYGSDSNSRTVSPDPERFDQYSSDIENRAFVKEREPNPERYHLYKRRFIGLAFMTIVNFTTNFERSASSTIALSMSEYFQVPFTLVETISSVSGFAFIIPAPFVIWILNKAGPKWSIVISCMMYLLGAWIHFIGTHVKSYPAFIAGTIVVSMASPFALIAPTRYSRLWFSDRGRTSATGIATLASTAGSAIGSIVSPLVIKNTGVNGLTLIFAIVATVVCFPSIFLPNKPPTPPSAVAEAPRLGIWKSIKVLLRAKPFYLQFYSFAVLFGAYEATSNLILEIIRPYGGTQLESGLANAVQVIVGLTAALIASPIIDRTKSHLIVVKFVVPLLAAAYLGFAFVPHVGSAALIYVMFAIIGALSFSVTPATLEFQVGWTYPASPEVSSTICWTGGFLFSSVFILIMQSLIPSKPWGGEEAGTLFRGLIFLAIMTWTVVPCSLLTGFWIFKRPAASYNSGM